VKVRALILLNYIKLKLSYFLFKDFLYRVRINKVLGLTSEDRQARGIKRTVRLVADIPGLWSRTISQTPNGLCQWGSTLFVASGPADYSLTLNSNPGSGALSFLELGLQSPEDQRVSSLALHMEPDQYIAELGYDYDKSWPKVDRFYTNSERLLLMGAPYQPSPPYVHFHVGKSFDFLSKTPAPKKTTNLSMIVSDIQRLDGHKQRLKFVRDLDESAIECSIFGRGGDLLRLKKYRGFVLNKWNVHARCRYSLVIENSISPLYWSEKFADAILGFSLPIYHGCSRLEDFFPEGSYIRLDINDHDALYHLSEILADDPYEARLPAINEARRMILSEQNLYAFVDRELDLLSGGFH